MSFTVYLLTNKTNGKVYVGKTRNLKARLIEHKHSGNYLHRAIKKYGLDGFDVEVLAETSDEPTSYEIEAYYVELYNSTEKTKGYNLETGGKGGMKHSEASKAKIRAARALQAPMTAEGRARISAAQRGKTMSADVRKRVSIAGKKRRTLTPEQISDIRASVEPYSVLAERYAKTKSTICLIRKGKLYV